MRWLHKVITLELDDWGTNLLPGRTFQTEMVGLNGLFALSVLSLSNTQFNFQCCSFTNTPTLCVKIHQCTSKEYDVYSGDT